MSIYLNPKVMNELTGYINEVLGIKADYKRIEPEKLSVLPFFLAKGYDFGEIILYNQRIILLIVKNEFTTEGLRAHLEKVRTKLNGITVAVIPPVEAYKRLRLIEKRVPFIIPGKQMYMPDLFISLKEYGIKTEENKRQEYMQPAAQFLLLYHLQIEALEGLNLSMIANRLNYKPMTITRAAYYLHNSGICRIEGTKEKFLRFNKAKRELWDTIEPRMINPVNRIQFYSGFTLDTNLKSTSMNALAHYTDLNDEPVKFFAMRPGYKKFIEGVNLKPIDSLEGNICIEEWKYDPGLLTKTEFVDPLSLYLCFRENKMERIEMALEELIEKVQW